ncbi:MAG: ImmA/IrrE family metallo-endopeptidase [Bacteroidetes bacterium]|nr:ImmA/IrrE family metallo-endopeptidase [Bacteroidota bacterium]
MNNSSIGVRVTLLRQELGLTQAALAAKMGFNHRQTLQAIERGDRKLSVDELIKLIEIGERPVEYFTDPFFWTGEGVFSFRADPASATAIDDFERVAGGWVMLWRWLCDVNNLRVTSRPRLGISKKSSFEDVTLVASRLASWFELGPVPALHLAPRLENELLIPVLFVDLPGGIPGATYHHAGMNLIFINRKDAEGRRNFDLAHELFHALTWEDLPPDRFDPDRSGPPAAKRREQLANRFASGLLLPEMSVRKYVKRSMPSTLDDSAFAVLARKGAEHFRVSVQAFCRRLVALELLDEQQCRDLLARTDIERSSRGSSHSDIPIFSRFFLSQLGTALDEGRLSVRRAASLLGIDIDSLADAFTVHDLAVPFEL